MIEGPLAVHRRRERFHLGKGAGEVVGGYGTQLIQAYVLVLVRAQQVGRELRASAARPPLDDHVAPALRLSARKRRTRQSRSS